MPQMSPLLWGVLLWTSAGVLILLVSALYFNHNPTPGPTPKSNGKMESWEWN